MCFVGIAFSRSSKFLICDVHWVKLGMPGVSITLKPKENSSTVTKSSVVPGAALSVRMLNFSLYYIFFGSLYLFELKSSELTKLLFPEFVEPTTYIFGLYRSFSIVFFHLPRISSTFEQPVAFLALLKQICQVIF